MTVQTQFVTTQFVTTASDVVEDSANQRLRVVATGREDAMVATRNTSGTTYGRRFRSKDDRPRKISTKVHLWIDRMGNAPLKERPISRNAAESRSKDRPSPEKTTIEKRLIPLPTVDPSDREAVQSTVPPIEMKTPTPNQGEDVFWWIDRVTQPNQMSSSFWQIGINDLIRQFVNTSPRLRSIQLIRESAQPAIIENHAEFDPTVFVETKFNRLNDPVGNTLTTGGAERFQEDEWTTKGGIRLRTHSGGQFEASQELGMQTNNSDFFFPRNQGSSFLSLNFTQPIMNGRGRLYNDSLIVIANLQNDLAGETMNQNIQDELLKLSKGYWRLYAARANWFQKKKNVERAEGIHRELLARLETGLDVTQTQLLRAKAAVETRKSDLILAFNEIKNLESNLLACTGLDPTKQPVEIVPRFPPQVTRPKIDPRDAFVTALSHRPEIRRAGRRARIAGEKVSRAEHEILPILDLVVSTYVAGLDDEFQFASAVGRQFSDGGLGYSVGLNFQVPLFRRAATARLRKEELQWQAITSDLEDQILIVKSEVDIAVRNVNSTYQTLLARETATRAARAEVESQKARLELARSERQNVGTNLNFLLDAQDRLAEQENRLATAQSAYMIAWINLKKAMGTLMLGE